MTKELLTSDQLIDATGISYRTLDNWVRTGLVSPVIEAQGSGSRRLFDPEDVSKVADLLERIHACPLGHGGNRPRWNR